MQQQPSTPRGRAASPAAPAGRPPRARNARGQGDRLRQEILAAVNRLVADDERARPLALSLREVAREAGVTAPAIYRHFAGKEELGWAAVTEAFTLLAAAMDAADARAAGRSPAARLAAQAHAYCDFAAANRGYFRLMFRSDPAEFGAASAGAHPATAVAERWRTAVSRLLAGHGGAVRRGSRTAEQAAMSIWSAVHGRLVLTHAAADVWGLGDVHEFVDSLVASLVPADGTAQGEAAQPGRYEPAHGTGRGGPVAPGK